MQNMTADDAKVAEMSFNVFEKILTSIDFKTKEELIDLANIMVKKVESGDYPEIVKLAYADARKKIEILTLDQLNEIKSIVLMDD